MLPSVDTTGPGGGTLNFATKSKIWAKLVEAAGIEPASGAFL